MLSLDDWRPCECECECDCDCDCAGVGSGVWSVSVLETSFWVVSTEVKA
jgi:hypothetical protein